MDLGIQLCGAEQHQQLEPLTPFGISLLVLVVAIGQVSEIALLIERLEFGWKSPHALSASTFASSCLLGFLRLAARGFFFGSSTTGVGTSESSTEGEAVAAVAVAN